MAHFSGFPNFPPPEAGEEVNKSFIVRELKSYAETELQKQNYQAALDGYSQALGVACNCQLTQDEIPKILCNRSMVLHKMKRYMEALTDAQVSMDNFPIWIKGYWRGCQVLKEMGQLGRAVEVLVIGLQNCVNFVVPSNDLISLFTELVTLLCRIKGCTGIDRVQVPPDKSVKVKIIQRLISNKVWEGVSYLVTGQFSGDNMELAATFDDLDFSFVPVGNLLKETSLQQKNLWAIHLAIELLKKGALFQQMESSLGQPAIHIGVQSALETGNKELLKFLLSTYIDSKEKKDMININGDTAIHVVVKSGKHNGTLGETILRLLINSGCTGSFKDMSGKYPLDYLKATDQVFELLQTVKSNSDPEKLSKQDNIHKQQEHQNQSSINIQQRKQPQTTRKQDDSWKQSYMPNIPAAKPAFDQCQSCETVLEECKTTILSRTSLAYIRMADVLKKRNHDKGRHQEIVDEMLKMITESAAEMPNPEIPDRLTRIPFKYYKRIVNGLIDMQKWRQLCVFVDEFIKCNGVHALANYARGIKIQNVITHSSLKGSHQLLIKIIESMLKNGAVMEDGGKECILAAVQEEQFKVLETLFNNGADPGHLSVNSGDTPIHAALSIAIERDRGNFSVFNLFFNLFESDPKKYAVLDPSQQDKNGDCLFHLLAKMKYNSTVQKATELLCDKKISSNVKNNENKLPIHYLNTKNDRRQQFFRLASEGRSTQIVSKKPKSSAYHKKTGKQKDTGQVDEITKAQENDLLQFERVDDIPQAEEKPKVNVTLRKAAIKEKIKELIDGLDDVAYSKFSSRTDEVEEHRGTEKEPQVILPTEKDKKPEIKPVQTDNVQEESEDEESAEEHFEFDPQLFENLEWEVECTADVWKALRDKHVLPELKQRIVRKIQHLAAGEWTYHICKKLHHVPENLRLFEAKITKGSRIIWELAIAFSPRLSESAEKILECNEDRFSDQPVKGGKIYSEIIRVWDIVFDHDKIYSSVQRIIKSHSRGETCIIQKKLKGVKQEKYSDKTKRRFPRIYAEMDIDTSSLEELRPYYPPASSSETEYHILKFYSFSSNLVSHILQNIEIKVDFPFRVTDLEHAIINLQSMAPILLLGRSGTGKTTCCLYRLWSRFLWYWTKAKEADAPLLPRGVIYRDQEEKNEKDENVEGFGEDTNLKCEETAILERQISQGSSQGASATVDEIENKTDDAEAVQGEQYDHLHQIFITKNAVLCSEVQKNFRELMHACDIAKRHVEMENQTLPNRLQDVDEYQFPIFVTSRQLLLMLDASMDPPYFFDRAEDGSLKVDIQGWTDGDGPLSILPLLQEDSDSDDESEEDEIFDEEQETPNRKKVDPRKEMTYELFSETIWPHMNKGVGKKYHPSLVWTEIMSFIKGSYEALAKPNGFLEQEEYVELGRKRAPNFSGEREHIYTLFKRYEHVRKQNFLFDETDLVRDVYHRVCKKQEINWVIHQIFVDETQDFTQAELCLLLRLCQNPNDMFLTGDTAQSIMRGISFRFSDLRSLFFYASKSLQAMGKTSGVAIPKQVYQLTHNYRSHAGILSLASSILDLMIEFFPESFDRLNKDQGLFLGPQPVLLESCSFCDLALLLRGNKRKTSHIEFGAHQAILVVNDAARENVPEELQYGLILTIYESKGLEFDDILLYNFFKDSQASKEWRVVTDFLEKLSDSVMTGTESLVQVSSEILEQKDRPRALTFDPNQHKVLNSELKYLYTAVTRARVNVWIFDEDMEKRAPMFEYFKARQLVKSISSDEVQNFSKGGMFAEESSPEEWIKRAQDFMKHNLYEVAAKCFRQGNDFVMEKVAMCHQRALKASRIKDNPAKMREEFLLTAEQYLEVGLGSKAAICLQNARERELVANLYEKMGQLEKAAETYRKLRRPIESSACYERMGYFDKAIDTLCDHELFDVAFDTLKRYDMQIKEYSEKCMSLPQHLLDHAPRKHHTEEQLAYSAAEMYHGEKNVGKMLASLNRLPNIKHRVEFLKKYHNSHNDYMSHAAKILIKKGEVKEAAFLYLDQGRIGDALSLFSEMGEKDMIGYCTIVNATIESKVNEDGSATSQKLDKITEDLKSAIDLFHNLKNDKCYRFGSHKNGAGEAELLLAQLTGDIKRMDNAWGTFEKVNPDKNEAGQLEWMNWMVYHSDLSVKRNLVHVVQGMKNLFEVLMIIVSLKERRRLKQIYSFYGLEMVTESKWSFNPQHKPRILKIIKHVSVQELETVKAEVSSDHVCRTIAEHLLKRGKGWFNKLKAEFRNHHKIKAQCLLYAVGIRTDACCEGLHRKMTNEDVNYLMDVNCWFVELECIVDDGITALRKANVPTELNVLLDGFSDDKYQSCKVLLEDLFQPARHFFEKSAREAIQLQIILSEKEKSNNKLTHGSVSNFLSRYLRVEYLLIKDRQNHNREKHIEFFMKLIFLQKLFGLDISKDVNLVSIENDLQKEFSERIVSAPNLRNLGFLIEEREKHVSSLVRRFLDGYYQLCTTNSNPMKALISFAAFIQLERKQNFEPILPELSIMMLWLEFYTVLAFCIECKFSLFPSPSFIIPLSYISQVYFIDSSFKMENGIQTFEAITRMRYAPESDKVRNRIERFVGILAGTDNGLNIIRLAFHNLSDALSKIQHTQTTQEEMTHPKMDYTPETLKLITIAERVLIISLVFLVNIDKVVYPYSETYIVREICRINLPSTCPQRLSQAVKNIKVAKGILDIVQCLKSLLHQRDDNLLHCRWDQNYNKRYGIVTEPLQKMDIFIPSFHQPETISAILNPCTVLAQQKVETEEDMQITAEQGERLETERKRLQEEQIKQKSALVIAKFIQHRSFLGNCRNLHSLCLKTRIEERLTDGMEIFNDISVDEKMCGICGEVFVVEQKSEVEVEYEQSEAPAVNIEGDLSAENKTSNQPTLLSQEGFYKLDHSMKGYMFSSQDNAAAGLSPLQNHIQLESHYQKQQLFEFFKKRFIGEIKRDIEKVNKFIETYELRSSLAQQLYKDLSIKILEMLSSYESVNELVRKIIKNKDWGNSEVGQLSKEMVGYMNGFSTLVEERYSEKAKYITKHDQQESQTKPVNYDEDECNNDVTTVVDEPITRGKFKRKKRGKHN